MGALLALVAGVGRTSLAMARHGDLPGWLAAVHLSYQVPHHAEIALAVIVCLPVLAVELRGAIGFSSFGMLLYYLIANVSAFIQAPGQRRFPRRLQVLGATGCIALVATLPAVSVAGRARRLRRQDRLGIAMGGGTDIAVESADVVIVRDDLRAILTARQTTRSSYRRTRQKVALAFLFNGIGIPAATTGLVYPVWVMVAMALSVTTIFVNSLGRRPGPH